MTERRVLVTGASSGLGLATTLHVAELGFTAIGLVHDLEGADSLSRAAADRGRRVETMVADLADLGSRSVIDDLELYGLVNNAGYINAGLLRDVSIDDARIQLEVMVLAPMDFIKRALPYMLRRGEGKIVNVTSAAMHTSTPFSGWYQAGKAALRELTDSLRLELDRTGIDVVDVEPGGMRTGIWPRAGRELGSRQRRSSRPGLYERPLRIVERAVQAARDPEVAATSIGKVLCRAHPRGHVRVGAEAAPLRVVSDLVPDRFWDRAMGLASGVGGNSGVDGGPVTDGSTDNPEPPPASASHPGSDPAAGAA